ncbi:MAG: DUF1653 domain-containing protein [Lachnospiraceae bacterium]|nr:DUF1653 domain-containing protein [Lachnospiraceae bacterium]
MAQGNPMPGEKYLHFKNLLYQVLAVAYHSETMEKYVVYQALYGSFKTYIRPYEMFISEVDHEKYPEVKQQYRFRYVEAPDGSAPGADIPATGIKDVNTSVSEVSGGTVSAAGAQEADTPAAGASGSTGSAAEQERHESAEVHSQEISPEPDPVRADGADEHINPWLDKILDARDFEEKYKIVCDMRNDITDRLIDDIAVVMDAAIPEGDLADRYEQLKYCLRTRQKYEMGRLRS